jgi:hypothetical protein
MERSGEMKLRIGILSASSQVASSVALYFKMFTRHDVTCFVRSSYSTVFFKMAGIQYQSFDTRDDGKLSEQFKDLNIILDFSYPSGQLFDIPGQIMKNYTKIFPAIPRGSVFINMSSIMAYGIPDNQKWIENYFIPRASYGYIKRKSEHWALEFGKRYGIRVFNFRLGQVHGFLQSVNSSFREKLNKHGVVFVDGEESDKTNTIFINSLCVAIQKTIESDLQPGTYTLVSEPQWDLRALYDYYKKAYDIQSEVVFKPAGSRSSNESLNSRIVKRLKKYRPAIETYFLMRYPGLSTKIKGRYKVIEAGNLMNPVREVSYIDFNLLGTPSLNIISGIDSSVEKVTEIEKEMKEYYNSILEKSRVRS